MAVGATPAGGPFALRVCLQEARARTERTLAGEVCMYVTHDARLERSAFLKATNRSVHAHAHHTAQYCSRPHLLVLLQMGGTSRWTGETESRASRTYPPMPRRCW